MLADTLSGAPVGRIEPQVILPATAPYKLIDFIAQELPRWRDDPERLPESSEDRLTSQLCIHLNSASRRSAAWSDFQFVPQEPDDALGNRTLDLAAKPSGATLIIADRKYTKYQTILPIECKRLPTPSEKRRDKREYVITEPGTTGGIQRFKLGYHGKAHLVGAMIGYVQDHTFPHWIEQVNGWIGQLCISDSSGWSDGDLLQLQTDDSSSRLCTLHSCHSRARGLADCELRHLWIRMN